MRCFDERVRARDVDSGLVAEDVRELFDYEPETGRLLRAWPVITYRGGVRHLAGTVAGSLHKDGYVYVGIRGRLFLAHRLIWLHMTGSWPKGEVDHRNGIRNDNRWCNLREATGTQNRRNTLGQRGRKGPFPGVYEHNRNRGRYVAQIKHRGKVHYLGSFSSPEAARQARIDAERRLFGEFAGSARSAE